MPCRLRFWMAKHRRPARGLFIAPLRFRSHHVRRKKTLENATRRDTFLSHSILIASRGRETPQIQILLVFPGSLALLSPTLGSLYAVSNIPACINHNHNPGPSPPGFSVTGVLIFFCTAGNRIQGLTYAITLGHTPSPKVSSF